MILDWQYSSAVWRGRLACVIETIVVRTGPMKCIFFVSVQIVWLPFDRAALRE
jgi:hypothetical protein